MSVRAFSLALLATFVSIAAAACSTSSSSSSSEAFVTEYCDLYAPCCTKAGLAGDGKQCKSLYGAIAAGSGSYDTASGDACLADLRASASKPEFCSGTASPATCDKVFAKAGGTKAPGAACTSSSECAPSAEGKTTCALGSGKAQSCQLIIAGKEGDSPCVATIDGASSVGIAVDGVPPPRAFTCNLKDNLRCDSSKRCVRVQDVGGPCAGDGRECVKTAYCDVAKGQCLARAAVGEVCVSSGQCSAGSYCDQTKKACTPSLADGAPCTDSAACPSQLCVNGACAKVDSGPNLGLALLCGK